MSKEALGKGLLWIKTWPIDVAELTLEGPAQALLQALALAQGTPWTNSKITAKGRLELWPHLLRGLAPAAGS